MILPCTHFEHMARKTVSLDVDVYRKIKRRQTQHESISATLRRVLEEERDPADYLDELFRDFGGKGVMTDEGLGRARARQANPAHSRRPARNRRPAHAA
jgi:predicted CopG family antitoxin